MPEMGLASRLNGICVSGTKPCCAAYRAQHCSRHGGGKGLAVNVGACNPNRHMGLQYRNSPVNYSRPVCVAANGSYYSLNCSPAIQIDSGHQLGTHSCAVIGLIASSSPVKMSALCGSQTQYPTLQTSIASLRLRRRCTCSSGVQAIPTNAHLSRFIATFRPGGPRSMFESS